MLEKLRALSQELDSWANGLGIGHREDLHPSPNGQIIIRLHSPPYIELGSDSTFLDGELLTDTENLVKRYNNLRYFLSKLIRREEIRVTMETKRDKAANGLNYLPRLARIEKEVYEAFNKEEWATLITELQNENSKALSSTLIAQRLREIEVEAQANKIKDEELRRAAEAIKQAEEAARLSTQAELEARSSSYFSISYWLGR